jgi:hypothetical protein
VATRLQTFSDNTLACIVDDEYPLSILRATIEYGEDVVVKKISAKICDYLDMVNLRSSMNAMQIARTAQMIVKKHPHLPIKAIGVFFEEAMNSTFGPHYNSMDISKIMEWLNKFSATYFDMVEERANQEHQSTKGDNENFIDILQRHKALAAPEEDKAVPMPDDFMINVKINRQKRLIIDRVHKENTHLYSLMSVQEADKAIDQLIQEELEKNNLTNN